MNKKTQQISRTDLRKFGLIMAGGLTLLFGLLFPWLAGKTTPLWPWIAAAIFASAGLIIPISLKPIYIVWMKVGHVLGWINTRIILAVVFYVIIFPAGAILRIIGHDPMARKLETAASSYRIISKDYDAQQMEKPY